MKHTALLRRSSLLLVLGLVLAVARVDGVSARGSSNPNQSGSTGLQGTIASDPPKNAPTISVPVNGRNFTAIPIQISGLCTTGLLVKVFSNNIFVGSVNCTGNSFSIQSDLLSGANVLVARQYDALDQTSPDSNSVNVTFQDSQLSAFNERVSLTSQYAKIGADVGATLTWPIILSGGTGPYAISVDWGDGSATDLISQPFAGAVNITHIYKAAGVYQVIVRATDTNGQTAFLQLVGVGNGKVTQGTQTGGASSSGTGSGTVTTVLIWWPFVVAFPLIASTFWLGKKYELRAIHKRIEKQNELYGKDK